MSLVLIPLFAAILQLGFAVYVRNTLAACAQTAARAAASADVVAQGEAAVKTTAAERAKNCIDDWVPRDYSTEVDVDPASGLSSDGVEVDRVAVNGVAVTLAVVKVEISGSTPVIGPFGLGARGLHVTGEALRETR